MDDRAPPSRTERGSAAERVAERYLVAAGFRIVARNVRYRRGEIDLVAEDGPTVVFVEVRARRRGSRFVASSTLGPAKRRSLLYSAGRWLCENSCADRPCRFDVVGVTLDREGYRVRHIRGAFVDDSQ